MLIIITTISIFLLTFLVWLVNKFLPFQICPICAGVFGTWVWLMIGYFLSYQINIVIPAILLGGSVVGLAFKLGEKLDQERLLLWKTLFISVGFVLAYSFILKEWLVFSAILVFLLVITYLFLSKDENKKPNTQTIEDLKNKMDKCC